MKDHRIFIVTYPGDTVTATSKAHYAPYNKTKYTLEEAHAEIRGEYRKTGKCFGIVDAAGELVYESSIYYADQKLPVKDHKKGVVPGV